MPRRPLRRLLSTLLAVGVALASTSTPVGSQQADFGSELYARDPWRVRLDASTDPASTVIDSAGAAIRVRTRAGAIVWRPADRIAGAFTVKATVQLDAAGSSGGAGLFFGGYDLEGIDRNYATCLVRPDGRWSIAHRNGVELHDFRPWARAEAVSATATAGLIANVVEWLVGADRVGCRINGVEMYSFARAKSIGIRGGLRTVDGDVGLRVDANTEATFERFEAVPVASPGGLE